MGTDLYIDPVSGDLSVDANGQTRLASGFEIIAQRLRIRSLMWLGEYILDQRVGVPYESAIFSGKGPSSAQATAVFRPIVAGTQGISRVREIESVRDGSSIHVTFTAECDGATVTGTINPTDAEVRLAFDDAAGRPL